MTPEPDITESREHDGCALRYVGHGSHAERIGWAETDQAAVESWNTRAGEHQ